MILYIYIFTLFFTLIRLSRQSSWQSTTENTLYRRNGFRFPILKLQNNPLVTNKEPSSISAVLDKTFIRPGINDNSIGGETLEQLIGKVGDNVYTLITDLAGSLVTPASVNVTRKNLPVVSALQKLQKDVGFLDDVASRTPQLTKIEFAVLFTSVLVSAISPAIVSIKLVEVIVPSMAALAASVGISAEYVGKVAITNGKEVSALAIQAAAEAEAVLATAERSKAILPLCVGLSTTASAFALLAPSLLLDLGERLNVQVVTEIYLICPIIAVLSSAIAGLASQEARSLANRAAGIGNRRFASSKSVGITWLSAAEQVELSSKRTSSKWNSFALGVSVAPFIAAFIPGSLGVKSIICAAIAAVQAAYYLSIAEYSMAYAMNAVAMKSRSAAVADTYANQGVRAGAILPFTSALAGLSAAASAAAVEVLPLIHVPALQSLLALTFPFAAALFGAAASVSKARCEADAAASSEAVSTLGSVSKDDGDRDPITNVIRLIKLSINTTLALTIVRLKQFKNLVRSGKLGLKVKRFLSKLYYDFFVLKVGKFLDKFSR